MARKANNNQANVVINDNMFNEDDTVDQATDVMDEATNVVSMEPAAIARKMVADGEAKIVKAVVTSVATYTNDQNFTSLIFRLSKPIVAGNHTTDSIFVGWKEVKAVLIAAGYEMFNTLMDFDDRKHESPADVEKAKQRINLCLTYLLPKCKITLLQREIYAGQEIISNPFSSRDDDKAYFTPNVDAVRYHMFDVELSAKATTMLDKMHEQIISAAATLAL